MAKSILQEVATLNAQMFNEAKLKSNIQGLEDNVDRYYVQIEQLAHKLENDYKMIVTKLSEETANSNEILRAEITQLDINLQSLQRFSIDEIAKYFYDSGSMKKEYRRADVKINESIVQLQLKKLQDFTGPILSPTYDDQDLQKPVNEWDVIYPTGANRNWIYMSDSKIMYAEYSFVALGMVDGKNTVTIGDVTRYSNSYFPGTVKIQSDTDIANGVLNIISPNSTDNSINVNGNIISDHGYLKVETGLETTEGDITTGDGDISTTLGNLNTGSGRFFVGAGNIKSKTGTVVVQGSVPVNSGGLQGYLYTGLGYVANIGGFVNLGTGDITTGEGAISTGAGDISTGNGKISCTGDITTDIGVISTNEGAISTGAGDISTGNGKISCTGDITTDIGVISTNEGAISTGAGDISTGNGKISCTGDITTDIGNITTVAGNITTGVGVITTGEGAISTGAGDITTGAGDITTDNGKISCTSDITTGIGNISISDKGNFYSKIGDFITDFGNFVTTSGNFHSVKGNLILDDGKVSCTGDITSSAGNLTLTNGDLTLTNGDLTVTGEGSITEDLTVGIDLTVGRHLEVTEVLNVTGIANLNGGVTMTGGLSISSLTVSGSSILAALSVGTITSSGGATFTQDVVAPNFYAGATGNGTFYGTATKALYADLAEKYESDKKYVPGTVLSIGLDTEVTIYNEHMPYAGIVSTDPAFLMNNKSENKDYIDVALKGRVPVLTHQFITRGMYIIPDLDNPGYCQGLSKQEFDKQSLPLIGICITQTIDEYVEVKV